MLKTLFNPPDVSGGKSRILSGKKFILCFIVALFISASLFADWDIGELLLASDGAALDMFGKSVSISGNYAVVGATGNDDNGFNSGSAYVFQNDGLFPVIEDIEANPLETKLIGNFPNPFNKTTAISFYLTAANRENPEIVIYNLKGQKIRTFQIPQSEISNINSVVWDGNDENNNPVSRGIYYYKLQTDKKDYIRKMILMK